MGVLPFYLFILLPLNVCAETPNGFSGPTWYDYRDQTFSVDGKGTFDNPVIINTPEQLAQLSWLVNEQGIHFSEKVVMLGADIDLGKTVDGKPVSWVPIGKSSERSFYGLFFGVNPQEEGWEQRQPHKISNMYLSATKSTYTDFYGLFGYCRGSLCYLVMDHVTINVTGRNSGTVGSLCGTMSSWDYIMYAYESWKSFKVPTAIFSVSVTDAKLTINSLAEVGGLVGWNSSRGVSRSSFEGDITATSVTCAGGIAGNINTDITDCAAKVNIKGGAIIGGIVGHTNERNKINTCVSTGSLTGGSNVGGICGQIIRNAKIICCSSAANVSGSARVGGIVGWVGDSDTEAPLTYAEVNRCIFTGHVRPTGSNYCAGGICGVLQWIENEHISRCLFAGRIDDPADRKKTENFGLILGKNSKPNNVVGPCYIDKSIAGTGKMSGTVETLVDTEFLTTRQLITGDPKEAPYLSTQYDGRIGFHYQAGFYPRPFDLDKWSGESDFSAYNCSESCQKLFDYDSLLKGDCVSLAQSWLCSVPIVIRKGDCATDFVSTAEVKRASTTFELGNNKLKLRINCLYPETPCIDVKDDVVSARQSGQCMITLTTSQDVASRFDIPRVPQAVNQLQLNVNLNPWNGTIATACAAGTGTVDNPYIIKNGGQLAYAVQNNNAYEFYEQICDITLVEDLQANPTMPYDPNDRLWIASNWKNKNPIWKANYDGTGHYIKGAYVEKDGCGFFGQISATGSVANLAIIDSRGPYQGGLFAGVMEGTITNCIAQGQVSGMNLTKQPYFKAGGFCSIVGRDNPAALIEDCITAVSSGYFTYADYTPFVMLSNENKGTVRNCLAVTPITHLDANYKNSGITASGKSYIKDCYWLKGYEEVPSGYTLEQITEKLGKRERWQTTLGYFPTLKTFAETDIAKLLMVPFRTDVDYSYDSDKEESFNYLLAIGRQILFEPGSAVWTNSDVAGAYLEVDTDMGVVVPLREGYDPKTKDEFDRIMPGMVFLTGRLGNAKIHVPVRARRGAVNAGFTFEDENARQACLDAFDTDGDNVLILSELKAATNELTLTAFQTETARKIKKFPEFRFFKNVTELTSQLNGLSHLEKVSLPYALQTLNTEAFAGCSVLKEVTLPSKLTTVTPGAFYRSSVKDILVDPFNESFTSRDGVLFTKGNSLVVYPNGRTGEEATVAGTISSIAPGAFYKVPGLHKLFFDTTDYTTVPQPAEGALITEDGTLMDVYVSDATYDHVLLDGYLNEPSWTPYVKAKKLHQYFPLKITADVVVSDASPSGKRFFGTFYIGFPTQLPQELTPFVVNSIKEYEYKAYYHDKSRLVPALQPVIVIAKEPGTYRLTPVEGDLERWPAFANQLIGVGRDGMPVNQGNSAQGSIMTLQMDADGNAAFLYEKKSEIEPYHCYLPFPTIDRPAELVKNAHYDLVYAETNVHQTQQGDFTFTVSTLLPDNESYAILTGYNGSGGNVQVPGTLDDGTPVTQIGPSAFKNRQGNILSIDMTAMDNLEAFDSDRSNADSPLGALDERTYVFLQEGKATSGINTILGDQCTHLQLNERWDFYAPTDFHADKITYDRVLRATQNADGSWTSRAYTICLPYDIRLVKTVEETDDVSLFQLNAVTDDYEFVFRNSFNFISAGIPAVIVINKGEYHLNATDVDVLAEPIAEEDFNVVYDTFEGSLNLTGTQVGWWQGTYRTITNEEGSEMHCFAMGNDGNWRIIRNDTEAYRTGYIGPFRCYYLPLEHKNNNRYTPKYIYTENGPNDNLFMQDFPSNTFDGDVPDYGDDSTDIRPVIHTIDSDGTDRYFDLLGHPLNGKPDKGIYINNGKKIIKK